MKGLVNAVGATEKKLELEKDLDSMISFMEDQGLGDSLAIYLSIKTFDVGVSDGLFKNVDMDKKGRRSTKYKNATVKC